MTAELTRPIQVDPALWPDVATLPRRGVTRRTRARIGRALFLHGVKKLPMRVQLPDGSVFGAGDETSPVMLMRRPAEFWARIGASGTIGFGEAFMAGDWESEDLVGVLTALCSNLGGLIPLPLQLLRHAVLSRIPSAENNTVQGSRRNISRHYDLSNEMFATFLDPTMTYSSALFGEVAGEPIGDGPLELAQHRKVDRLLDLAGVGPGTRLLEIGTGWGELALRAAARGATVHTVTISAEQAALAAARIAAEGLSDRVTVDLRDYREVQGSFDAIVSVEMIEAVGLDHLPEYVETIDRLLAPGGKVALQAITMGHDRMLAQQHTYTWIRKYIFPGGLILSLRAIKESLAAHTRLEVSAADAFGLHYAETLRQWRATFEANWEQIAQLGFDETFRHMWSFYLAYSEAGFRSGYIDVYQLQLQSAGHDSGDAA